MFRQVVILARNRVEWPRKQVLNMSRRQQFFVSPRGSNWQVKQAGQPAPVAVTPTQAAAIEVARGIAKITKPSQVVVQRPNGEIRTEHTYGSDPRRTRG
jgi:hypothetical protein